MYCLKFGTDFFIYLISIQFYIVSIKYLSNIYQISIKYLSNRYYELKHLIYDI